MSIVKNIHRAEKQRIVKHRVNLYGDCRSPTTFKIVRPYSSGLLRRPSEYAWISFALLRIPHSNKKNDIVIVLIKNVIFFCVFCVFIRLLNPSNYLCKEICQGHRYYTDDLTKRVFSFLIQQQSTYFVVLFP